VGPEGGGSADSVRDKEARLSSNIFSAAMILLRISLLLPGVLISPMVSRRATASGIIFPNTFLAHRGHMPQASKARLIFCKVNVFSLASVTKHKKIAFLIPSPVFLPDRMWLSTAKP